MFWSTANVTYYNDDETTDTPIAAGSRVSVVVSRDRQGLLAQEELNIPSLEADLEEFTKSSSLSRLRRNAAEKHRIYQVRIVTF